MYELRCTAKVRTLRLKVWLDTEIIGGNAAAILEDGSITASLEMEEGLSDSRTLQVR